MDKFETTIREIFHLIAEYGVKNTSLDFTKPHTFTEKDKTNFLIQVHKGFRLGQDKIVNEIIPLLKNVQELKTIQKKAKADKKAAILEDVEFTLHIVQYKIKILRNFADFMAWQFFKNDYYKARRFYSGNRNRPDLLNSNLESVLYAVEQFHKEDEKSFALISDLTSFIDIGDILLVKDNQISVVECKSGNVQSKVFDFLDELEKDEFDPAKVDYSDKNKHFFDQVERTLKQYEKGQKLINFLKTEKGTDPFSKTKINVVESTYPPKYYFDYLISLIEESKQKKSAYGEIEEILYIGVYRSQKIIIADELFREILDQNSNYKKRVITSYLQIIDLPLKEPLFFKPFGVETIFDLLFSRLKVLFAIDLDKLIELFNKKGIKANWLNKKDTAKLLKDGRTYKPFIYQNRAISIIVNDRQIVLGDSFLIYLMLDNLTPTSFVERYKNIKKDNS